MKFRKKPVVIEAVRCADAIRAFTNGWAALPAWIADAYERGDIVASSVSVLIKTLEGAMLAEPDDWIIRGVKGELYPCKPEIFEATYEAVDE